MQTEPAARPMGWEGLPDSSVQIQEMLYVRKYELNARSMYKECDSWECFLTEANAYGILSEIEEVSHCFGLSVAHHVKLSQ